jgi:hypothetical protein
MYMSTDPKLNSDMFCLVFGVGILYLAQSKKVRIIFSEVTVRKGSNSSFSLALWVGGLFSRNTKLLKIALTYSPVSCPLGLHRVTAGKSTPCTACIKNNILHDLFGFTFKGAQFTKVNSSVNSGLKRSTVIHQKINSRF